MPETTILQMGEQHPVQPEQINWKQWAKVGAVFAVTTGACLVAKTTGAFGLLSKWAFGETADSDAQETDALTITETENQLAHQQLENEEPITELLSPALAREQKAHGLKLAEFEELPLTAMLQKDKRNPMEVPQKIGTEFQVNTYTTTTGSLIYPSVANLVNGKFVIVWQSGCFPDPCNSDGNLTGIYGQMFYENGTRFENEFIVNTYTIGHQYCPDVTSLDNGKFVTVWRNSDSYNYVNGIYGQIFNDDGTKYLTEIQIDSTTGASWRPSVASLNGSKFVVTWCTLEVYCQILNSDSSVYVPTFQVNTYSVGAQESPSVASLSNGKFVIVWEGYGQEDNSEEGIYGQMFYGNGTRFENEFLVNTYTTGRQRYPYVEGLMGGNFVVTWCGYFNPVRPEIYGQIFNANGTKYELEFQINTSTLGHQQLPSVSMLNDGKFVVVWTCYFGQTFYGNGTRFGNEFQVTACRSSGFLDVKSLNNNNFVVVFPGVNDIYGQIFSSNFTIQSSTISLTTTALTTTMTPTTTMIPTTTTMTPTTTVIPTTTMTPTTITAAPTTTMASTTTVIPTTMVPATTTTLAPTTTVSPTTTVPATRTTINPTTTVSQTTLIHTSTSTVTPTILTTILSNSESALLTDSSGQSQVVNNIGIIIGAIVGGLCLIACISGTIVFVTLKRVNKDRKEDNIVLGDIEQVQRYKG